MVYVFIYIQAYQLNSNSAYQKLNFNADNLLQNYGFSQKITIKLNFTTPINGTIFPAISKGQHYLSDSVLVNISTGEISLNSPQQLTFDSFYNVQNQWQCPSSKSKFYMCDVSYDGVPGSYAKYQANSIAVISRYGLYTAGSGSAMLTEGGEVNGWATITREPVSNSITPVPSSYSNPTSVVLSGYSGSATHYKILGNLANVNTLLNNFMNFIVNGS